MDPEVGDRVSYTTTLAADSTFSFPLVQPAVVDTFVDVTQPLSPDQWYWWKVSARDRASNRTNAQSSPRKFYLKIAPVGVTPAVGVSAAAIRLWPNPTSESLGILLAQPFRSRCDVEVFAADGRRIVEGSAGDSAPELLFRAPDLVVWSGRDERGKPVPSGTYWVRVRQDGRPAASARALVLR